MNVTDLGEFGLIQYLDSRLKRRAGTRLSIGDDGALLNALQHPVVTTDALVENVHFKREWTTARSLGRKSLAVNVSDLAACGARPVAAFIALALPKTTPAEWIGELYDGLEDVAEQFDFTIAGGDVVSAPQIVISLTLIGELLLAAQGRALLRSEAQVGDVVCVTGTLGDSAAGLRLLLASQTQVDPSQRDFVLQRHFEPTPRLVEVQQLLEAHRSAIHAAMDLSDGLAGDAKHIAHRSGLDIVVHAEKLPISPPTRAIAAALQLDATDLALSGGEDYELLLCIEPTAIEQLQAAIQIPLTVIGEVMAGKGKLHVLENGQPHETRVGWRHF